MKRTPLYFFARHFLAWFFAVLTPMRAMDAEKVPLRGGVILCCNHSSMTDPIRLAFSLKRQVYYMAKEELFRNRFISFILKALGAFPVSRGRGDKGAIGMAKTILDEGRVLGVFLEGTRSKDGNFLRRKAGAVMLAHRCCTPIVPCCITPVRGKLPKNFHSCTVAFGDPIPVETLGILHGTPSEYRAASALVMKKIAALREKSLAPAAYGSAER